MALPVQPAGPTGTPVLSIAEMEAIIASVTPSEWVKPESLGAKVEESAAKLDAVRTESNQAVGRLRGALKVKAGEELKVGETLCTLSSAYHPANPQKIDATHGAQVANKILISTAGVVTLAVAVKEAEEVFFDGTSYPIN